MGTGSESHCLFGLLRQDKTTSYTDAGANTSVSISQYTNFEHDLKYFRFRGRVEEREIGGATGGEGECGELGEELLSSDIYSNIGLQVKCFRYEIC